MSLGHRIVPYLAVAACALLLVPIAVNTGIQTGGDSARYLGHGGEIVAYLAGNSGSIELDRPMAAYFLTNTTAGIVAVLFPGWRDIAWVVLQVVLYLLMVRALARAWVASAARHVGGLGFSLAIALIVGLPAEATGFLFVAVGSDAPAMAFAGLFLCSVLHAMRGGGAGAWSAATALALVCALIRPSGMLAPLLLIVVVLCLIVSRRLAGPYAVVLAAVLLIVLPGLAALVAWPAAIYLFRHDPLTFASAIDPIPSWVPWQFHNGVVVKGLRETWMEPPSTLPEYVVLAVTRLVYFLAPFRPGFSPLHIAVNTCYVVLLVAAVVSGWRVLRRRAEVLVALALAGHVWLHAVFYSALVVDDFRYPLPIWPALWLLGGIGLMEPARSRRAAAGDSAPNAGAP